MGTRRATSWAGTTLADRRSDRRRRLLDVGLELLGTHGSAAVSVRSVCRHAELTDRYFYESFADREALLLAVYDEVAARAEQVLLDAVQAGAGEAYETVAALAVEAFLELLVGDPRIGRVLLLEPLTDATLGGRGAQTSPVFAAIIATQLPEEGSAAQLTATALVGALTNLFVRWLDGALEVGRAELAGYCVRLLVTTQALARPPRE